MSPYEPISFQQVRITDSFWSGRQQVNFERSLPKQYEMCRRTGRIDALRLQWKEGSDLPKPHIFWDSDSAKWLEAACYACAIRPDAALRAQIDALADLFVQAQQPDGYLNSYFTVADHDYRWKELRGKHELYCAGHIIEAAVAHHDLTGRTEFLDAACRYADYIDSLFGLEERKRPGYCGHPEIELALMRLWRTTGRKRYLDLATYFVNQRGVKPVWFQLEGWPESEAITMQAHLPVREQHEAVGHVVRAIYLYCGMTDVGREVPDESLTEACRTLWKNVSGQKMYVTGGVGSDPKTEGFSANYDLPNEQAYCETCASVALIFWTHRMLRQEINSAYTDVIERALYNSALAGMSLDGETFFYPNPLASYGHQHRQDWFEVSCCPSNLSRLLGSLGNYLYSTAEAALYVHLYLNSETAFELGGVTGKILQGGGMPWQGNVRLELKVDRAAEWTLHLRKPGWTNEMTVRVNGEAFLPEFVNGYGAIRRTWSDGDVVELDLPMEIQRLMSDPRVIGNAGQVALRRGPFVYCIEDADFPAGALNVSLPAEAGLSARFDADLLDGVTVLEGTARTTVRAEDSLYAASARLSKQPALFRAIPYFTWDNRQPGAMRVWIPE